MTFYDKSFVSLLAVSVFWTLASVSSQAAPAASQIVQGIATTADGKPLVRATLYFPDSSGQAELSAKTTVVTDDQGRFTWSTSNSGALYGQPGQIGPQCYAFPDEMGSWRTVPSIAPDYNESNGVYEILRHDAQDCVTKWITVGDTASFSVVAPDMAIVTMRLRGPDGMPLANHKVELSQASQGSEDYGVLLRYGATDASGRLRLRCYPGLTRLQIVASGAGFGSTGYFEAVANQETILEMPPLARLASISGAVDPALGSLGTYVIVSPFGFGGFSWYRPRAYVDAQGRFSLTDVVVGSQYLFARNGASGSYAVSVELSPGEDIANVNMGPPTRYPVAATAEVKAKASKRSVHGRVTDASGHPASGVDVYALCTYFGFHGPIQETQKGKTDADGAFVIRNLPGDPVGISVWLYASQTGRPLTAAPAAPDSAPLASGETPSTFHGDLILPDGHSGLIVCVLRQGKPIAGVKVSVSPHGGQWWDGSVLARGGGAPDAAELIAQMRPSATTNADGEATFEHLAPGLWDISASVGDLTAANGGKPTLATGSGIGAAVGGDEMRRFTLNVHERPIPPVIRVLDTSGKPLSQIGIQTLSGAANATLSTFSSLGVSANGEVSLMENEPGLKRISPRYRDKEADGVSLTIEPVNAGDGYVAVSPAIPSFGPVTFRTASLEGGRLRIRLQDAQGQPTPGCSIFVHGPNWSDFWASADPSGEAVFSNLPSGEYTVQALSPTSRKAPKLGADSELIPPDSTLTDVQIFPPFKTTIASGGEVRETIRAERQGYIRGKVGGPEAPKLFQVCVNGFYPTPGSLQYDRATGKFLAGPFPVGKTKLEVVRNTPSDRGSHAPIRDWRVDVKPGKVTHVTLVPAPLSASPMPAREYDPAPQTAAQVFLSDGVTPAWGAEAAIFLPNATGPSSRWNIGADGHLVAASNSYFPIAASKALSGSPTEPVIVAWLPGTSGAVIVPYTPGETKRITLPAPNAVHGHVTIGGAPVTGLPSSFRVLAVSQGHGKLDPVLGFDLTTQDDGSFDLRGLTPGTYQIQAARDGIWLSETKTLVVGDQPLPDLAFDIGAPGAATIVHLRNAHGKPSGLKSIHVARPAGPLTDILWPDTFPVDSAGDVRLEGLETGPHQISDGDGKGRARLSKPFAVPAFTESAPMTEVTVALPGD
jgi:hypothetical protein